MRSLRHILKLGRSPGIGLVIHSFAVFFTIALLLIFNQQIINSSLHHYSAFILMYHIISILTLFLLFITQTFHTTNPLRPHIAYYVIIIAAERNVFA